MVLNERQSNLENQFLNSLKRGNGKSYLIVKTTPAIDFSNQIIKGALNIFAYRLAINLQSVNFELTAGIKG